MKKILPFLLILVLLLSACSGSEGGSEPAQGAEGGSAAVEPPDHTVIRFNGDETEIQGGGARDEGSAVVISAAGTYELTGVGSTEKSVIVDTGDDAMDVTVILNNVELTSLSGPAIHVKQAKHFRLQLAAGSQNRLVSGTEDMLDKLDPEASGAALYSEDDMDIEGDGALVVYGCLNNGIGCKNDLDINSGAITVFAANNGIKGNDSVQIKGGAISVTAGGDGIKSTSDTKEGKGYVELIDGNLAVEAKGDGIQAATELRISGGNISVSTLGDGAYSSSKCLKARDGVILGGGSVALSSMEDAVRATEGSVSVTGGELVILAKGDGIQAGEKDSSLGDVSVSGGSINISAGKQAVKARGSFSVTGGSLIALSGSGKQAAPLGGRPFIHCSITGSAGTTLSVGDLLTIGAQQDYKCLLCSMDTLPSGQTLTVTNGVTSVTATVR